MRAKKVDTTAAPSVENKATAAPPSFGAAAKDSSSGTSQPTVVAKDNILTIPNLLCVSR